MSDKKRRRKYDKETYQKRKKEKSKAKHEREIKAASRQKRNYIRRCIKPYYDRFRNLEDKHLMLVLKDTENMERILLQRHDLGENITLLTLPTINATMVDEFISQPSSKSSREQSTQLAAISDNELINEIVAHYFGVKAEEIQDIPQSNMMVFRDCNVIGEKREVVPTTVRPYDPNKWYNEESTSVGGRRVYGGKKLQTFFKSKEGFRNTYVFQDTISEILLYKAMMKKISYQQLLADHSNLAQRQLGNMGDLYLMVTTDEEEIFNRFKREDKESEELEDTSR